jgi:hypothetical protein
MNCPANGEAEPYLSEGLAGRRSPSRVEAIAVVVVVVVVVVTALLAAASGHARPTSRVTSVPASAMSQLTLLRRGS